MKIKKSSIYINRDALDITRIVHITRIFYYIIFGTLNGFRNSR